MEEIKNFISTDLNNKANDINRFVQEANEQEFKICRFFIGWGIASIGTLAMFYLQNINIQSPKTIMFLLFLREAFLPLAVSISLGVIYHLFFSQTLLETAKKLDRNIRNRVATIIDQGSDSVPEIQKSLIKEYTEESIILIGFKGFLYSQIVSFLFGILVVWYAIINL